jgi:hypothetical protein
MDELEYILLIFLYLCIFTSSPPLVHNFIILFFWCIDFAHYFTVMVTLTQLSVHFHVEVKETGCMPAPNSRTEVQVTKPTGYPWCEGNAVTVEVIRQSFLCILFISLW